MNKKGQKLKNVKVVLSAIFFLSISIIHPLFHTTLADGNDLPAIPVEKLVWDGTSWADTTVAYEGETVVFSVSIYNPFDEYIIHFSGIIYDILPCNLEYVPLSSDISTEGPIELCEQIDWDNNTVYWHKVTPIQPHEYRNFTYSAIAVCCGDDYEQNELIVHPNKLINVCNTSDVIENDGSLTVSDSASVKVICEPDPDISIEKKVYKDGCWMDSASFFIGDTVQFKIRVTNTGAVNLTSVQIVDTLPSFLTYNDDANITPSSASDHQITWMISQLDINETIELVFSAQAIAVGDGDNFVIVTSCQGVSDSDTAYVIVEGMIVSKKVWDVTSSLWVDEIVASVGDTIRFRITVSYFGSGTYALYNIRIRDELPNCLQYAYNANPVQTAVSSDGKTIWWNLSSNIPPGGHVSVEFDALVTGVSGCGTCINLANVTANECSGHVLYGEDTATVTAKCPLIADAHGPYYGKVCHKIHIEASATGGTPPYVFTWDLTNNGLFNDHSGKSFSKSWLKEGIYPIHVKVTDSQSQSAIDSTVVIISGPDNQAPGVPSKPQGSTTGMIGISYTYSTSSTDPDDDLIRYGWDWNGDGTVDEWTGFYPSGSVISLSHVWTIAGSYSVRVKAEDEHGLQSDFSLPLSVVISENQPPTKPLLSGPTNGRINTAYTYSAVGTDPDGDNLFYWFDWGDGTNSGWIGPYSSGQTASVSHSWTVRGSYPVRVRTKDVFDAESVWSDPLQVSMPKTHNHVSQTLSMIVQFILQYFPFLSPYLSFLSHHY